MDLKKYIYAHCIQPKKLKIWDAYSKCYVVREIPCGKCLHCRKTKVNEWTTRLYAEQLYSKYVYYITLDYAPFSYTERFADSLPDGKCKDLAIETAAVWHNLNKNHTYGLHPILLKKNHLQDYFKRLRFNTGKKFKYFACGEYGTKAEGTGYGRPHFHIIVFSQVPFTHQEFQDAWCVGGYKIGNVDFNDLVLNGTTNPNLSNGLNSKFVFKYVCKYLQKGSIDFESLATIKYHRAYFKSLQYEYCMLDTLFPEIREIEDRKVLEYNWNLYIRDYSPFVCCSKRKSIGFEYFEKNKERFSKGDFRLFGLSKDCSVFPSYYLRKSKEFIFPLKAIGEVSGEPTTNARIGYIFSVLHSIYYYRFQNASIDSDAPTHWIPNKLAKVYNLKHSEYYSDSDVYVHDFGGVIKNNSLHFYNTDTKIFYQFTGYGYNLWHKYNNIGFTKCGYMDIIDVLNYYEKSYNEYFDTIISPFHELRVLNEEELNEHIELHYKGRTFEEKDEEFHKMLYAYYKAELDGDFKTDLLTNNSKNVF